MSNGERAYRFGLKEGMPQKEVVGIVKDYTERRRSEIAGLLIKDRRKIPTLQKYLTEVFTIHGGDIVCYSECEPIEALIETYVEEKIPEKTMDLDRGMRYKAELLRDVIIGKEHIMLHEFVYKVAKKEIEDIIADSTVVKYAKAHDMEMYQVLPDKKESA
jgi:hypothetical protein